MAKLRIQQIWDLKINFKMLLTPQKKAERFEALIVLMSELSERKGDKLNIAVGCSHFTTETYTPASPFFPKINM